MRSELEKENQGYNRASYAGKHFGTKFHPSRKHLRTKVTLDFHLEYSKKLGKSGVGIKMIKSENFDISP